MESQADADGLRYAARAGYDPKVGAEFMGKVDPNPMADKVYLKGGYPPTRKRIQAMKDLIEQGRL
jgi:predicted Zn-dependent protease